MSSSFLPFQVCWFVYPSHPTFPHMQGRHWIFHQRESKMKTQVSSSCLPFRVAVGLSLSSNFSHCMWAAGTTVYFTKENRREKPKCHLSFTFFSERLIYLCSQLPALHVGSRHYSIFHQRESKRKTQVSSTLLPPLQWAVGLSFLLWVVGTIQFTPAKENRRGKPKCHIPFFSFQ